MQNFPQSHPLFDGIDGPDLRRLIVCLDGGAHAYERGKYVLRAGDPCAWVGIVCAGSAHVVQEDFWGNRSLLTHLGPGDLFGEAFACAGAASLPVSVVAAGRCDVRLLRARAAITDFTKRHRAQRDLKRLIELDTANESLYRAELRRWSERERAWQTESDKSFDAWMADIEREKAAEAEKTEERIARIIERRRGKRG